MADEKTVINVDLNMFGQDADAKTAAANEVAKSLGISDEALAQVEEFKAALTAHNAWDLPFMGYVNEDGYGYAYVAGRSHHHEPVLGCAQGIHEPAGRRADRFRHPYAVHPPPCRPLRRRHVPALPPRLPGQLRRQRRQQVLTAPEDVV